MTPHPLRWLALVALHKATLPSFEEVAAWYAGHYLQAPPLRASGGTENLLTLTVGEFTAAATLVPRPIPPGQLEGPAETAWYWPQAAAELSRQAAHVLVTLVDEGGRNTDKALALTRLTAAVAATAPSVGVLWGPGRLVHPPGAFIDQTATASVHSLPLFLWVDFRVEQIEAGVRLFTTGLEALGASELEVPHYEGDPQELLRFVYNIAHYQLDRRKVISEGDSIGVTDHVQATAHRGPSMLGGDLEVIRLDFEASA
ncbi:MAG TPA: DUF4261 domain-containing protein [Lacipirellulaceae bacterium]|nr:DUF4261 domain-containing protein [Lacipirellulaceae bacterium]